MQAKVISTTATRATRIPMTAPTVVLLTLVVLSSSEVVSGDATLSIVVVVEVFVGADTLSIVVVVLESLPLVPVVVGDCVTVTAIKIVC